MFVLIGAEAKKTHQILTNQPAKSSKNPNKTASKNPNKNPNQISYQNKPNPISKQTIS